MTNSINKTTTTFWIISAVALLWNLSGVYAYLEQAYMTDEVIATLPEPEQMYYNNVEAWVIAAFAIAVFAGTFGCLALLFRKKMAFILFILSLIAVLLQATYNFYIQKFMPIEGVQIIWTLVIILIAILLVWFSKDAIKKGILS